MKGRTKIKSLGTVNLEGISLEDGRFEVHMPIEDVDEALGRVLDQCTKDYIIKHSNVESRQELYFDVRITFSCNSFPLSSDKEGEFYLFIIIWQSSDEETGKDTAEFYEDVPVFFDTEDTAKLKRIVWNRLEDAFFNYKRLEME